jgi:hypothetical protein
MTPTYEANTHGSGGGGTGFRGRDRAGGATAVVFWAGEAAN